MTKSKYTVAQNVQYGTFLNEVGRGAAVEDAARHLRDFSDAEKKKIVDTTDGGVDGPSTDMKV